MSLHQPAAAPRHLLDRGPRPADRRPPGDQPGGADRREARREPRRRDDRRRRRQGRRDVRPPRAATPAGPARRRSARSSTSARRGSSASPRSTRRCSGTASATGSRCAPTAACGPAATSWSRRSSAPRSSRSGRRCSSRSAATWPASATSTRARPGSRRQREDLRAKFAGTPEQVERFALALAEDLRRELAAVGARIGRRGRRRERAGCLAPRAAGGRTLDLARGRRRRRRGPRRPARRADPASAGRDVRRGQPASPLEQRPRRRRSAARPGSRPAGSRLIDGRPLVRRRRCPGALERGELRGPIRLELRGAAGQSFGAFAGPGARAAARRPGQRLRRQGPVGRALVVVRRSRTSPPTPHRQAIAGNTCLYGATGGRLHVVGRAGMRFAVRNSGASAVVEGLGPHGCEYMTGGVVVVLGPVGANFGAGMTGGRAYLYDPDGRHVRRARRAERQRPTRLSAAVARPRRTVPSARRRVPAPVEDHREAGSALAGPAPRRAPRARVGRLARRADLAVAPARSPPTTGKPVRSRPGGAGPAQVAQRVGEPASRVWLRPTPRVRRGRISTAEGTPRTTPVLAGIPMVGRRTLHSTS